MMQNTVMNSQYPSKMSLQTSAFNWFLIGTSGPKTMQLRQGYSVQSESFDLAKF